ncbi:MAG: hypothetical protein WDN27_06845 [Candidatus Saccharibacteria bacterium]
MSGVLVTLVVVGTAVFAYIIGSKSRIAGFFMLVTRQLNRLLTLFKRGNSDTINVERTRALFEDLHDNYMLIRKDIRQLKWPFFLGADGEFLGSGGGVRGVCGVRALRNFGAVIIAYAVANFAGLVSVLPGGVGIYEGLMTLVLTATACLRVSVCR